ncbi:MAG: DUF5615 family PIN-like protein [Nitrospiraceae bacterium]
MSDASLFIRLYLDEDVSVLVAQLLHPHGFEVLTTRDAHNLGSSDAAQLRYAGEHHWTLLTHNRIDYELLHAEGLREQRPHAGILIANRRAFDFDLARRIMTALNRFTPEEVANQLLYL